MAEKLKNNIVTKKEGTVTKKTAPKKKTEANKAKKLVVGKAASKKNIELQDLDRKGLAARARLLKKELLAIRFNLQSPSLRDYRNKRKELVTILSRLGSN